MNTSNITFDKNRLFDHEMNDIVTAILFILCLSGILQNFIVILVFYRENVTRKPINILLLNLFVAGMLSGVILQPYIWLDYTMVSNYGDKGKVICALTRGGVLLHCCADINYIALAALSISRYLSVVHNYQSRMLTSKSFVKVFCAASWLFAVIKEGPIAFSFTVNRFSICMRSLPEGFDWPFFLELNGLFFLLFLAVISFCNASIWWYVWKKKRSRVRNLCTGTNKRLALLSGLFVVTFVGSWGPFFILMFTKRNVKYSLHSFQEWLEKQWLVRVTMIFIALNPVLDPIIYAYSCIEHRRGLANLFRDLCRRKVASNAVHPFQHRDES